jgi:hypothetical protein
MPASSRSRFWNSASIFFCARIAGTESRRMRSVCTKPNLPKGCDAGAAAGACAAAGAASAENMTARMIRFIKILFRT